MNALEREQANTKIDSILGTLDDFKESIKNLDFYTRVNLTDKYYEQRNKLMKLAEKYGIEKLSYVMIQRGRTCKGITPNGSKYYWEGNNGINRRSMYCGTLRIDGKVQFTSGTIQKVIEYIINN